MIDPTSGFITEVEPLEENNSDHENINCYTGVQILELTYPCVDLVHTSDEEGFMTDGVPKDKKRVWCETDKQEWLKIYQEYMHERRKRLPQPLEFHGNLSKDIIVGRDGFRAADNIKLDNESTKLKHGCALIFVSGYNGAYFKCRTRRKLKQVCSEDDRTKIQEFDNVKRVKTVQDLNRYSERGRVRTIWLEYSEGDNNKDLKHCNPNQNREDIEAGSLDRTEMEEDKIKCFQNERMEGDLVENCDRTKTNLEDIAESGLDRNCEAEDNTGVKEYEDVENLVDDFSCHERKETNSRKVKALNLRYNSLKLLKYSNICLFKWTKHYFVCYECREWFKDMRALRIHVRDSHSYDQIKKRIAKETDTFLKADITDLECSKCCVMLNSLIELENHLIRHNIRLKEGGSCLIPYKVCSDTLTCQLCEDGFATRYQLQKHMDKHFLNTFYRECNMGFRTSESLRNREPAHIKIGPKLKGQTIASKERFKCTQCSQKFRYDYKRLQHMIVEHNRESKLFQCEFCPKIFMTVHWLTKHMNCVHQKELYS